MKNGLAGKDKPGKKTIKVVLNKDGSVTEKNLKNDTFTQEFTFVK